MTKFQLATAVAQRTGQSVDEVIRTLEATYKTIQETNASGESVIVRQFGTFEVVLQKQKTARNILKKEIVIVPARYAVKFKVHPPFKKRVAALRVIERAPVKQ